MTEADFDCDLDFSNVEQEQEASKVGDVSVSLVASNPEEQENPFKFQFGSFIHYSDVWDFIPIKSGSETLSKDNLFHRVIRAKVYSEFNSDSYEWDVKNENTVLKDLLPYMYAQNPIMCNPDSYNQYPKYYVFEDNLLKTQVQMLDPESKINELQGGGNKFLLFVPRREQDEKREKIRYRLMLVSKKNPLLPQVNKLEILLNIPKDDNTISRISSTALDQIQTLTT